MQRVPFRIRSGSDQAEHGIRLSEINRILVGTRGKRGRMGLWSDSEDQRPTRMVNVEWTTPHLEQNRV